MHSNSIFALGDFIKSSPTAFHAIETISETLAKAGFKELSESAKWDIKPGDKCFVKRNHSSIMAFTIGSQLEDMSFNITCSHSDSPTFKIKENCEIAVRDKYTKLNTEVYGDLICSSWMDRPLSIAGRAVVRDGDCWKTRLVKFDRDLCLIPNQAIHMDRDVNEKSSFNKQKDTLPLLAGRPMEKGELHKLVAEELDVELENLQGVELYLYNRMNPTVWGLENEFFSCSQIDDLECAFAALNGFLAGENSENINVFACFDNEEVGSATKQGAASTMLQDVLKRINGCLGGNEEDYLRAVASSFMVSCDNAHAVHPNHVEETDQDNCVYLNEGIAIKSHACQKYTSDAVSAALFRGLCEDAGVPYQYYANRSDKASGSTLGNLAMAQVSLNSVDVGLPQLAMHSSYETAGVKDLEYFVEVLKLFYSKHFHTEDGVNYTVK